MSDFLAGLYVVALLIVYAALLWWVAVIAADCHDSDSPQGSAHAEKGARGLGPWAAPAADCANETYPGGESRALRPALLPLVAGLAFFAVALLLGALAAHDRERPWPAGCGEDGNGAPAAGVRR